jgi:acetoin utilization protein AcuB
MIIGRESRDLYNVMDIFRRYDIFVQAITVHHGFGENQRLLTIRVMGDELDDMLDALRRSKVQINRIQVNDSLR